MGFWSNLGRLIGLGGAGSAPAKAQARSLLRDELACGYKPTLPGTQFWDGSNQTPDLGRLFSDAEAMLAHPRVEHALSYYKAGTANAEIVLEDASRPEHGEFLQSEAKRFFGRFRPAAQRAYEYGRGAAECVYDDSDGAMRLGEMHPKLSLDCRVLASDGTYAGVRIKGANKALDLPGQMGALPAKAFWLAHNRRYSRWYGMPRLYAAWRPWRRLAGRDGAEDIVDGGVYRFAFQPPIGRYPGEDSQPPANDPSAGQAGVRSINRDKMRQMLETLKAGGVVVMSSRTDDKGQYVWDVRYPDGSLDVGGLLAYTDDLEKAISLGIGVPPELLEASDVGSGYSGRMIPLEAFYVGQQCNAEELLLAWYLQIGRPLLWWNFGPGAWGRLAVADLLKTRMKAMRESSGEGQPQQPPSPGRPLQMSTFDEGKHKRADDGRFGSKPGEHGQGGQGRQAHGSQGGRPAESGPSGPETPEEREALGKADQAAEARVSAFQKALQAIDSVPVVNWITGALGWVKDRTVAFYGFLKERYGPRQAVAIMGSGQLAGWATTGIGLAMGVPLVIPGLSIVASIPAMAAAEVFRQVRGAQKGSEAEPPKTAMSAAPDAPPDPDEVRRMAQEFADSITRDFVEWLKANPVPAPEGQGGGKGQEGKPAKLSTFDESKVRRADDGRFGDKPGEHASQDRAAPALAGGSAPDPKAERRAAARAGYEKARAEFRGRAAAREQRLARGEALAAEASGLGSELSSRAYDEARIPDGDPAKWDGAAKDRARSIPERLSALRESFVRSAGERLDGMVGLGLTEDEKAKAMRRIEKAAGKLSRETERLAKALAAGFDAEERLAALAVGPEPEEPAEPPPLDEPELDEDDPESAAAHAAWQEADAEREAKHEKALAAWEKAHAAWEKADERRDKGYDRAVEAWEKASEAEKAAVEAASGLDIAASDAIDDAKDDLAETIEYEEGRDEEPEEPADEDDEEDDEEEDDEE